MWSKNHKLLLLLASVCFLSWSLDTLSVTIMEARNFISAREMVQDGNILIPTLNAEFRLEKPPLPTWMTAVCGYFFGFDRDWPLRIPAVLMGLMSIWFLIKIVRQLGGKETLAYNASWLLLTSFYFFFSARSGMWDIFCHAFMLGAISYYIKLWFEDVGKGKHALVFGLFFAASFMSKGPIAPYALFLPFVLAFHISYRSKIRQSNISWSSLLKGIAVILIVSSIWPLYIYFSEAGQHASEVIAKESANWTSYEVKPIYYYWSFPIQSGLWTLLGFSALFFTIYVWTRSKIPAHVKTSLLWTVFVIVLLSVIPEKKSRYLLPVLFPLSMLMATLTVGFAKAQFKALRQRIFTVNLWLLNLLFVLLGIGVIGGIYNYFELKLDDFFPTALILIFSGAVGIYYLSTKKANRAFGSILAGFILCIILGLPAITHQFNSRQTTNSLRCFRDDKVLSQIPLFSKDKLRPELIWSIGRKAPIVDLYNLPEGQDTIGLFGKLDSNIPIPEEINDQWDVVHREIYNENPVNVKREKLSLKSEFRMLVRKHATPSNH